MSNLKQLKEMMDTPADKGWFKKFGSPKQKVVSKMNSKGCLAKAEKGEKPVTGKKSVINGGKDTRTKFMKELDEHKADRRFW